MKKMPIPKRKGKNRAQAKGSTWEFELLGAFSGLVLLVCAGLFFFSVGFAGNSLRSPQFCLQIP